MNKLIIAAAVALTANVALAQSTTERNGILADNAGRTLYVFTKDAPSKSNCYGGCAAAWPPFMAAEGARPSGAFSIVTRDDGSKQWAIGGKPLYYFAADVQAGDMKGEGQGGVWFVVRPTAARTSAAPATTAGSPGYY